METQVQETIIASGFPVQVAPVTPRLLAPYERFNWEWKTFLPGGILGMAFISLVVLGIVTTSIGFYMSFNEANPGVDINKVTYYAIIEQVGNVVFGCSKDPTTFIEPLEKEIRTVAGQIACAQKIMTDGNHDTGLVLPTYNQMEVETESGHFYCAKGFDPSEEDFPKALDGIEDLAKYVSKDPNHVSKIKSKLASNDYKTSKIAQTVHIKMGTLSNLKDRLAGAKSGRSDPTCKSDTYREEYEKFLCAHVILGQIPQGSDCYNRKDKRHIDPALLPELLSFERGDLDKYQGEAELERFKKCAVLLDRFVIEASLSPVQLLEEREKKIENDRFGQRAHEKCRKFD